MANLHAFDRSPVLSSHFTSKWVAWGINHATFNGNESVCKALSTYGLQSAFYAKHGQKGPRNATRSREAEKPDTSREAEKPRSREVRHKPRSREAGSPAQAEKPRSREAEKPPDKPRSREAAKPRSRRASREAEKPRSRGAGQGGQAEKPPDKLRQ